jgi:hypothetical protein
MTTKSESTIAIALVVVMLITVPASVVAQSTSVDASGPSSPKEPGDEVTIQFELTNTGDENGSGALEHTVPDGWEVVSTQDDGGQYSNGNNGWLWSRTDGEEIDPGESKEPSVTFEIPSDEESGNYDITGTGQVGNSTTDSDTATVTVQEQTDGTPTPATPTPATPTPATPTDEPTPTLTFAGGDEDDDDDDETPPPETPTPETPTPTADTPTPETPTPTADTPTPTVQTPTDTFESPSDTPDGDDGISTFLILFVVLIVVAAAAAAAYYFLVVQE